MFQDQKFLQRLRPRAVSNRAAARSRDIQSSAKERTLGCVTSPPARGQRGPGRGPVFFAELCMYVCGPTEDEIRPIPAMLFGAADDEAQTQIAKSTSQKHRV